MRTMSTIAVSLLAVLAGPLAGASARSAVARPDLVVAVLANPPAAGQPAMSFGTSVKVANRGRAAARRTVVAFRLSRDRRRSADDVMLPRRPAVKVLRRGAAVTVRTTLTLPAELANGQWFLIACADASAKVRELREANNCRTAGQPMTTTTIAPPAPGPQPQPQPGPQPAPAPAPQPTPAPNQSPTFGPQTMQATQQNTYSIVMGQVCLATQRLTISLSPGATDPDGDPISYSWTATNGNLNGVGLTATWDRLVQNCDALAATVTVTASDGRGGTATHNINFP